MTNLDSGEQHVRFCDQSVPDTRQWAREILDLHRHKEHALFSDYSPDALDLVQFSVVIRQTPSSVFYDYSPDALDIVQFSVIIRQTPWT